MRRIAPILLWQLALGLLLGALVGAVKGGLLIRANDYLSQGLGDAALYTFQATLNRTELAALALVIAAAVLTLLCLLPSRRPRAAAAFIAVVGGVLILSLAGYVLNRWLFWSAWHRSAILCGTRVSAAFGEPEVLAVNAGLLALSVLAAWLCHRAALPAVRRLGAVRLRTRWRPPIRPGWIVLVIVFLLLGANLLVHFHRAGRQRPGPNLILISLDTLRADHLGCYGYERDVSPNLDALAASSVLFENAITQAGSTYRSHSSVLTSQCPVSRGPSGERKLSPGRTLLAEILLNAQYRTAAFAHSLGWLTRRFGFDQGFETFVVPSGTKQMIRDLLTGTRIPGARRMPTGEEITARALSWLRDHRGDRYFLFLHYGDVHSDVRFLPYDAPEPYGSMFLPADRGRFEKTGRHNRATQHLLAINRGEHTPSEEEYDYLRALYDGGIRYADACLGELIRGLQSLGMLDDALIVVFSDHGEAFGEHGHVLHGWVYREIAHVLLMIRFPEALRGGTRVTQQVALLDIVPTVLDEVQIAPRPDMLGRSLLPVIRAGGNGAEAFTVGTDAYSLRKDGWMYRYEPDAEAGSLYDLKSDPGEQRDVITLHPEMEAELARRLFHWVELAEATASAGGGAEELDRGTRELLKSLGYLGGDD